MSGAEVWLASTDEERWSCGEEYPTREAAIAGAPAEFDLDPCVRFFVGKKAEIDVRQLAEGLADTVIDQIGEWVYEEAGDAADGWPCSSKEDDADLGRALAEAVSAWVDRRGLTPNFFVVREITQHVAPDVETIDAAALQVDGQVFTLPRPARHSDLYRHAVPDEVDRDRLYGHAVEGFVTSTGRFVDRVEAARIARAARQARVIEGQPLQTVDLW